MDNKEETSDADSGIILHSGPDSPASPMKELTGHTRVVRLKHKALEDRLERCLQELKQLCIREAELTGKIPREYPLQPGETPPLVRQRVGAAFVLKEENVSQEGEDMELTSLETSLALQQQILEAARNLCLEEHPSRSVRRSRLQQCKREEVKLKKLQQTLSQHTPLGDLVRNQLFLMPLDPLPSAGSLQPPLQSMKPSPPQTLELPRQVQRTSMGYEHSPIQNSPWSESSLDQPYQKSRKPHSASSSRSCSPAVTPRSTPVDPCLGDTPPVAPPTLGMALEDGQPHSAPCTPELHQRRTHSQSTAGRCCPRLPKYEGSMVTDDNMGCARLPRRRASDFSGSSPLYPSSSEDSGSEHSLPSYSGSPCREGPAVMPKPPPPPYRYHLLARRNSPYTDAARVIGHHSDGHHHYHSGFHGNSHQSNFPHGRHYSRHQSGVQALAGTSLGKPPQVQRTASSGCAGGKRVHPADLNMGHLYFGVPPPPFHMVPPFYEYWQEDQEVPRALPLHVRLAHAPSLRECSPHYGGALPQVQVHKELRSWKQHSQTRESRRPHSLDRLGPGREHRHQPMCVQAPQRQILQRAPDGTPVQWFEEQDREIVSQV